jgi:hypothetical protein
VLEVLEGAEVLSAEVLVLGCGARASTLCHSQHLEHLEHLEHRT